MGRACIRTTAAWSRTSSCRRLQGEPITLYGDGQQTRSFCYVDDLIDGFVRLMASPAGFTGPVNIGNPSEFTMRELADLVVAETGLCFRTSPTKCKFPLDDPKQRRPDTRVHRSCWALELQR